MSHVVVTAVGRDRPGIVAAVTRVLVDEGCNLEDTSMTILRGQFAMMLVVDVPAGRGPADLESALSGATAQLDLLVTAREIGDDTGDGTGDDTGDGTGKEPEGDPWTVSVYGADRPGIVYGVASLLAGRGVNIVDLTTRVIGDPAHPVYAMLLDVSVPAGADVAELAARLSELAGELGVDCTLHPSEADIL